MSERPLLDPLPFDIGDRQRRAADPSSSIWVEANAGSGKTRVLTNRVLRLLLSGVRPDEILCLTYTKAAAAEMRQRISASLAEWALATDADLSIQLRGLTDAHPSDADISRARTLFAHALETPGGLKIQTIHAFCESILHRFPVEAGVPIDFSVLEDFERDSMVLATREAILAGGLRLDSHLNAAVAVLFEHMTDQQIAEAINTGLGDRTALVAVLADRDGAKRRLRALVGADPSETPAALVAEIVDRYPFTAADHRDLHHAFPPKGGNRTFEDKLARLDVRSHRSILATFLTGDGAVPKGFPKKAIVEQLPVLAQRLLAEGERLEACHFRMKRAALVARSEALLDVLGTIFDAYEDAKRARSLLDFDDLVDRLGGLLRDDAQGAWVRYKLDGGITHILVDESQDTNPEQWAVVKALADEFFSGDGAVEKPRTLFAVGDGKQSIYSFQGAEPALFLETGREYRQRAKAANKPFDNVPLTASFRTLGNVLKAVDRVFQPETLRKAVLADTGVIHDTARRDAGGEVVLWPPVQEQKPEKQVEWPVNLPAPRPSAVRQVAGHIADTVASWVREGRTLGARNRPVRPEDVLILVQSRSALFHEIIRALHSAGLATPGADRLNVTRHIAVLDLLALGDVLLNPADDLQLAALLRSPLFDIDEDLLHDLAHGRDRARLFDRLAIHPDPRARDAAERLAGWRGRLDFDRPFNFYAEVLGADGGLRRYHQRFGREVDDVFNAFLELALAHEQSARPSLQGFVAALRERDVTIKRELSEKGSGVRVMTVHGAKGLEAPIVVLADAATRPDSTKTNRPLFMPRLAGGPTLIHASSQKLHLAETASFQAEEAARQQAEYWRKLYVAMTRAEDELYVTGVLTQTGKLDGSWYEAITNALEPDADPLTDDAGEAIGLRYPKGLPPHAAMGPPRADADAKPEPLTLPPLPRPTLVPVIQPSRAGEQADAARALDGAAASVGDAETARRAGLALHALLQHLPGIDPLFRPVVGEKAMAALWPDAPDQHPALIAKALAILDRPELQHLFGPDSRAEVPFLAHGTRDGKPVTIAGRIDRLVVGRERVLVVDFKSDATPILQPEALKEAYRTQIALYARLATQLFPEKQVQAAILWTNLESLLELPMAALADAAAGFTIG
jgi:ATP-dependent helicase/nuclease subunit A